MKGSTVKIVWFIVLAPLLGMLIGYFLSTYIVIALTVFTMWLVLKPAPSMLRGSGNIGAGIFVTAIAIYFLLGMWITWFYTPGSTANVGLDMQPVLDFLRHYILK